MEKADDKARYFVLLNANQAWVVLRYKGRDLATIASWRGPDCVLDANEACDALNKAIDMKIEIYPAYHEVVAQ